MRRVLPEQHGVEHDREDQDGYGASSSGGIRDEEDTNAAREKLRLWKDQSVVLEESFKEHNTLNPKQKMALAKTLGLRLRQVEVWFQNKYLGLVVLKYNGSMSVRAYRHRELGLEFPTKIPSFFSLILLYPSSKAFHRSSPTSHSWTPMPSSTPESMLVSLEQAGIGEVINQVLQSRLKSFLYFLNKRVLMSIYGVQRVKIVVH